MLRRHDAEDFFHRRFALRHLEHGRKAELEHFFFDVDFLPFPDREHEAEALTRAKELFETGEIAGIIRKCKCRGRYFVFPDDLEG